MPAQRDAGAAPSDTERTKHQPAAGFHLDGDAIEYLPRSPRRETPRRRVVELILRSTPPGATAAIDGAVVGTTPTYWSGEAEGKTHEFTFVKSGYSMSRYRFVATQSGIVHATLDPLVTEPADAGAAVPPQSAR